MIDTPRYTQKLKTVSVTLNERELKELMAIKKQWRKSTVSDTIRSIIAETSKNFFASK